jgi:glucan biosynthesis protein C
MGLFFFFSGYFTPGSYDRKGAVRYWKDRLLRLAIPMVIYTWFLSRIPNYIDDVANNGVTQSFWQYSAGNFWTDADGGPTWFLFALLAFCIAYTLWRFVSRRMNLDFSWVSRLPAPGTKALLAAVLVISAAMFAVAQRLSIPQAYEALGAFNLLLAFFPAYILMFAGGILAYRNQWLSSISGKLLRFWAWFSAALVVILPAYLILGGAIDGGLDLFMGGMTWQCAGMCLWFGCACIAFSTTLTLWLRDRILPQNKVAGVAGPNTFAVYLIHPLVLVPICYGLSFISLPALIKFVFASVFTVSLSYLLAGGLRRLPGAKEIL